MADGIVPVFPCTYPFTNWRATHPYPAIDRFKAHIFITSFRPVQAVLQAFIHGRGHIRAFPFIRVFHFSRCNVFFWIVCPECSWLSLVFGLKPADMIINAIKNLAKRSAPLPSLFNESACRAKAERKRLTVWAFLVLFTVKNTVRRRNCRRNNFSLCLPQIRPLFHIPNIAADDPSSIFIKPVRVAHNGPTNYFHVFTGKLFPCPVVQDAQRRPCHGCNYPEDEKNNQDFEKGERVLIAGYRRLKAKKPFFPAFSFELLCSRCSLLIARW